LCVHLCTHNPLKYANPKPNANPNHNPNINLNSAALRITLAIASDTGAAA